MAQITKKVDRTVPAQLRTQVFTQADAVQGDILLIEDSLGRVAKTVQIQAIAVLGVAFNVLHTIYPPRNPYGDGYPFGMYGSPPGSGLQYEANNASITLDAGETLTLDKDIPIKDIKLNTVSGNFEIFVA